MTIIETERKNGLVINQVNISNAIKIILTKFADTVAGLPLTYFSFEYSSLEEFLISIGITLARFDAKYLNEFKPNCVVLTVFLKISVILNYCLILQTLDVSMENADKLILPTYITERTIIIFTDNA